MAVNRVAMRVLSTFLVLSILVFSGTASADEPSCSDFDILLEHSQSAFAAIQLSASDTNGSFDTNLWLTGADHCAIHGNLDKRYYRCVWQYPIGDKQAGLDFQRMVQIADECLVDEAKKSLDQSVNHPDTYHAHIYNLPGTEIRITFKNKSGLSKTLVSLNVDSENIDGAKLSGPEVQ